MNLEVLTVTFSFRIMCVFIMPNLQLFELIWNLEYCKQILISHLSLERTVYVFIHTSFVSYVMYPMCSPKKLPNIFDWLNSPSLFYLQPRYAWKSNTGFKFNRTFFLGWKKKFRSKFSLFKRCQQRGRWQSTHRVLLAVLACAATEAPQYYSKWYETHIPYWLILKSVSVTNKSVGSRTAAADNVDHNSSTHVSRSGRPWTDGLICNLKGLEIW